jgi:branched-chain amino acid transport system substrate-binding protein
MRVKHWTLLVALALAAMTALTACGPSSDDESASTDTIKLGWGGPLTGESAEFGQSWLNGVKLGLDDHKLTGALKDAKVELKALDDAGDPQQGVTIARRHISDGAVAVFANMNSGVTLATEPVYHRAGLPQLTESSNPSITDRGYKNVFQLTADDNLQGGSMAEFAAGELNLSRVAMFNDSESFGQGVTKTFGAAAEKAGIKVLGNTGLDANAKDYTAALSDVLGKNPDGIYFGGNVTVGGLLCRQARAAGFTGPFLGPDQLYQSTFVKACGKDIGRAYVTFQSPPYDSTPELKSFADAYEQRFGEAPGPYSVYGYNQAGFLLTAMEKAGTTDPKQVVEALHALTFDSLFGPQRADAKGQLIGAPLFVYAVKDGDYELVTRAGDAK